eukprot:CAMPEP_0175956444 /NCGR_PEP_ID=MMETSP0108-20121206/33083_1 /TAXON_ID=195067 ORGANISM="Goniomonas pacifica, Strain CCMP1869" /NCGR_SAMPLE_ID=MMETSP0108 /ASSEMBLY_ACC=CAM_ASM_000204 /LENGTH=84 /DNA_ID=CAMNT_0017283463 /DNA_START=368 /DNA_END=618 /DNA_ORIENTATION=+
MQRQLAEPGTNSRRSTSSRGAAASPTSSEDQADPSTLRRINTRAQSLEVETIYVGVQPLQEPRTKCRHLPGQLRRLFEEATCTL